MAVELSKRRLKLLTWTKSSRCWKSLMAISCVVYVIKMGRALAFFQKLQECNNDVLVPTLPTKLTKEQLSKFQVPIYFTCKPNALNLQVNHIGSMEQDVKTDLKSRHDRFICCLLSEYIYFINYAIDGIR